MPIEKMNKSWDSTWEQVFRARDWARYPQEELIRFVAINFYSAAERKKIKILDAGCGTGAGVWFIARERFDAFGIDGSETGIMKCKTFLAKEGLKASLQVGDCISLSDYYPPAAFDAVAFVGVLYHNKIQAARTMLDEAFTVLKPGGKIFATAIATGSYGDGMGTLVEERTFINIPEGALSGVGLIHFFTLEEVRQLFAGYADVKIGHLIRSRDNLAYYKHWIIEAVKP
jgi:SAM-dependent methyltransferase